MLSDGETPQGDIPVRYNLAPPASPASPSGIPSPCSFLQQFAVTCSTVLCLFLCSSYSLCLECRLPALFSLPSAELVPVLPRHWTCHTVLSACGSFPAPGSPLQPQHPAQGPAQSRHEGTFVGLSLCPEPPSPFRYWKLDPAHVYASGPNAWDTAVHDASEEYKHRMVGEPLLRGTRAGTSGGTQPDPALPASPA